MSKKLVNVKSVRNALVENIMQEREKQTKSAKRNVEAYEFAYQLLNTRDDELLLDIRENKSSSYNVGDIAEAVVQHVVFGGDKVGVAGSNESDLNRSRMNEVKAWSSVNRYPNSLKTPYGFIAVSKFGIYYISKASIEKRWDTFSDHTNGKRISRKELQEIIAQDNPQRLTRYEMELGL